MRRSGESADSGVGPDRPARARRHLPWLVRTVTSLSLVLATACVLAAPAGAQGPGPSGQFCDTAGHAHEAGIARAAALGIARGGLDGCFRPDAAVTRGQMASFLHRGYGLPQGEGRFCDIDRHPHEAGIRATAAAGIAHGGTDGCYRPDSPVTRGQLASFLSRAEQLPDGTGGFCDTAGHTHARAVAAVAAAGIAQGFADGCFRPDARVTRGHMASLLVRALEHVPAPALAEVPAPTLADVPAPEPAELPALAPDPAEPVAPATTEQPAPVPVELVGLDLPPSPAQSYDAELVTAVNAERASRGLSALTRDACADGPALLHAGWMAGQEQLDHQPLAPVLTACSAVQAGENVGHHDGPPGEMVQLWLDSAPHRALLLDPTLSGVGAGAAQAQDGRWYVSLIFLTR